MPKRKADKIEFYKNKIRKLENKAKYRRRVIVYSSSSSDSEENNDVGASPVEVVQTMDMTVSANAPDYIEGPTDVTQSETTLDTLSAASTSEPSSDILELDPELLLALGEAADEQPGFGENIHQSLAQRWLPILKKGLVKETKEKLFKEYLVPENCKFLKAPTLNAEISAAIPDISRNRDKNILITQDQLGHGIAAISKAITFLLLGEDKVKAIKVLTDGCRILTDLHFVQTQVRSKLITPRLEKSFLSIIPNKERDDTLFGNDLPEKIKVSKAIEKQSLQIKKPPTAFKPASQKTISSIPKSQYQGNWMGPLRFAASSRGGRTANSAALAASTAYRRPPPTSTRSNFRGRPRATKQ